jgi:HD-GYP domain-containing protein (c-di-GMP phosphodiesterase class II)
MSNHPFHGYQMLKKILFLQEAAEIVYAHHERFDGMGYPRGLKRKDIPLGARITAVANTLDAITSDLSYRPANSIQAARKEIEVWSGRQFDPEVVKVFLAMSPSVWEDLRKQIHTRAEASTSSN